MHCYTIISWHFLRKEYEIWLPRSLILLHVLQVLRAFILTSDCLVCLPSFDLPI
jgi:hypothetical protein